MFALITYTILYVTTIKKTVIQENTVIILYFHFECSLLVVLKVTAVYFPVQFVDKSVRWPVWLRPY